MLSVLLINDSVHSALKKSQRVLAKYLPQVGPTTYMGSLSKEGLSDLEAELSGMRSRYLSVGCYLISRNLSPELMWIVGSKKNFDVEQSLYAHRRHALTPELPYTKGTYTSKLLALVVRLAALTHDTGKMNDAFQAKLWRACKGGSGPRGEFIRHDAMSYRVLQELGWSFDALKKLPTLTGTELASLTAARSAAELEDSLKRGLNADLLILQTVLIPGGTRRRAEPLPLEELVCRASAFLSLTHHRLPGPPRGRGAKDVTYDGSLIADTYVNPGEKDAYQACTSFSAGNVFQLDTSLGDQLRHVLDELAAHVAEAPVDFNQANFLKLILTYGRPILVLSDYMASGLKSGEPVALGALLGNTIRPSDESLPSKPGDTLATHIRSVHWHARKQAQFALNLCSNQLDALPSLSTKAQRAIDAKRSPVGKFAWQAQLHDHLKTESKGLPAFVAITAGTGSGKTIASAQAMRALSSGRWTYCLGLRSLTLQTGLSYQDDLQLSEADLAIVIGDQTAKKAFEQENEPKAASGSESSIQDEGLLLQSVAQPDDWLNFLSRAHTPADIKKVFTARKVNFASAPVVVCTIDQLIGVTRMTTISKAFDYKRLQSADLVLDEIDNYSPEELKHVARLCYLVGLSRKNIICLSATMGSIHVEALFAAYHEGLRLNHQLTGLGSTLLFTTAANNRQPESLCVTSDNTLSDVLKHNNKFNEEARAASLLVPPKAKLGVLNCAANDYSKILGEAIRLHSLNANKLDDGTKVSAGFIRMNTVGSARSLAKYLMETEGLPEGMEISVVCYHAKYTGLEMSLIDRALNTLTNRKRLKETESFSEQARKEYINPLLWRAEKSNLIIIAVTTSIIETGRDHDYDWAVLEPSSHRSIIQGCGRIRRHRDAALELVQNVTLIKYPARAMKKGVFTPANPVKVFSYPGPLTSLAEKRFPNTDLTYPELLKKACHDMSVLASLTANEEQDSCASGFELEYLDGVRNSVAITPPAELTNSLAILEQYVLFKSLTESADMMVRKQPESAVSVLAQQQKALLLSSWAYQEGFRDADFKPIEDQVFLLQIRSLQVGNYAAGNPLTRAGAAAAQVHTEEVNLASPARSLLIGASGKKSMAELLSEEAQAMASKGFTDWDLFDFSCYSPTRRGLTVEKVFYNELLGFNQKPTKS